VAWDRPHVVHPSPLLVLALTSGVVLVLAMIAYETYLQDLVGNSLIPTWDSWHRAVFSIMATALLYYPVCR
jgi:hypothetical protein